MAAGPLPTYSGSKTLTGFRFHFVPPLKRLQFALDRFAEDVADFSELWKTYDEMFQSAMERQFDSQGVEGTGRRWRALTPAYKAWKEKHYPGRPIGQLTGALKESMTGGEGYEFRMTPVEASFGQEESASAAQYGRYFSEEPGRRPVIRVSGEFGYKWAKTAHVFVYAAAREVCIIG